MLFFVMSIATESNALYISEACDHCVSVSREKEDVPILQKEHRFHIKRNMGKTSSDDDTTCPPCQCARDKTDAIIVGKSSS